MDIRENNDISFDELLSLYESVGWTSYTAYPNRLRQAYENSLFVAGAYDGGRLIGAVRAVGDGVSIVFIQDLLVRPEYQRRGVGTRLMRMVMERYASVYQMELLTDDTPGTVAFYRSLGFERVGAIGCCAFIRQRTGGEN